jgi:ABC-type dipeptide/oligopeptide/nickel transport system permease subunit
MSEQDGPRPWRKGRAVTTLDMTRGGSIELPAMTAAPAAAASPFAVVRRRLRADRVAIAALATIAALVAVAIAAPLVVKLLGAPAPDAQSTAALDSFGSPTGPSGKHLLGVDPLGRDVLSRIVYGARVSLQVALVATAVAVAVGTLVGMLAGYYRGWVDTVLSRTMDVLLAFPILLLGIGLASACSLGGGCAGGLIEPGIGVVTFVIALATWPYVARIVRGQVLSLREREFVEAARATGASDARILAREILPNLAAPIVVCATLLIPANVLLEAALSFLGVGVQPPTASWGQMIAEAAAIFDTAWWYMVFPGLALLVTVLAFNLVGDGLQDALNPRTGR